MNLKFLCSFLIHFQEIVVAPNIYPGALTEATNFSVKLYKSKMSLRPTTATEKRQFDKSASKKIM